MIAKPNHVTQKSDNDTTSYEMTPEPRLQRRGSFAFCAVTFPIAGPNTNIKATLNSCNSNGNEA